MSITTLFINIITNAYYLFKLLKSKIPNLCFSNRFYNTVIINKYLEN